MAFNPFTWFRRHQKKLIVVVTVFVMFIFIASFGKGDVFEAMTNYFGRGGRGEVVATIYGTKYKETEVDRIGKQRKLVSDFLFMQAISQHSKVLRELLDKELKHDAKARLGDPNQRLGRVCSSLQGRTRQLEQMGMFAQAGPQFMQMMLDRFKNEANADLLALEELATDPEFVKDSTNLARLHKVGTLVGFQLWQFSRPPGENLYFGGNSKKIEDTLDFIVWRYQADKLKIHLTDPAIAKLINDEAAGHEVFADPEKVNLEKHSTVIDFHRKLNPIDVSIKDFAEALRDAFRVNLAQAALLGSGAGVRGFRGQLGPGDSPAAGTPDEFLHFYREMRTILKVQMLAVPVEKFLDKVPDPKSDTELLARYAKFKDQEPNPIFRDPGFKEPRRILVQYLVGDSGNKVYRDRAKQAASLFTSHEKSFADRPAAVASLVGLAGQGPTNAAFSLAGVAVANPLRQEYERYADQNSPPWLPPGPNADVDRVELMQRERRVRLGSVNDAASIASAIGGGSRNPLGAVCSLSLMSLQIEVRDSMRQTGGVLLGIGDPQNLYALTALALATQPKTFSYDQMSPQFLAQLEERLARQILRDQLDSISKELNKLKKEPVKAEEFLAKTLKENPSLKLESMPEPRSQLAMGEALERKGEAKLGELYTAFQKRQLTRGERDFVGQLFGGQGAYEAQSVRTMARFIEDDDRAEFERSELLWWRKDDLPARVRPFDAVRGDVLRAWKMDYARQNAREVAEKLQREIRAGKFTPADAERFLLEKQVALNLGPIIELSNVSRLVVASREVQMVAQREDYRPYQFPSDKQLLLPYMVPEGLVRQLLTMERPGEAVVVSDNPETTYYIAVLEARDEPSVRQFREMYALKPLREGLYSIFTRLKADDYRRDVIDGLRREAAKGKVDKEGRFEIPEIVRKRESRDTDIE